MNRRVLAVLAAAAAGLSSFTARAFNPQPEPPGRWGLFGIVADETARVSVVNTSGDPRGYPAAPCRVSLAFVDAHGNVLRQSRVLLQAGQSTALDYDFVAPPDPERPNAVGASADRGGRQDLRARTDVVNFNPPPDPDRSSLSPLGPCVPAVEVLETATGRTRFTVAEARMGWGPNHNETLVRDSGE
jgi:hypothetical protein